jgi:hypothetical protein
MLLRISSNVHILHLYFPLGNVGGKSYAYLHWIEKYSSNDEEYNDS